MSCKGTAIAELPALLFLSVILFAIPLLGMATFSFRAALFNDAVKCACMEASRATSFSEAERIAASCLTKKCAASRGITLQENCVTIICKEIATGSETESPRPIAAETIDLTRNLYIIKVSARASILPLLPQANSIFGMAIPGFTQEYGLVTSQALFAERPNGLAF